MLGALKRFLDRIPSIANFRRRMSLGRFELRDIYNSYFSRSLSSQVTPYGFKLIGSSSIHHAAMQRGEFEPEETALFSRLFDEVDVFVDVGANVGFYTCLAKTKGIHVLAVEPMEKNLDHLFQNLSANSWDDVEVFPLGLSGRPGVAKLYGASSTGASLIQSWAGASRLFSRTISLSTLDILLGDRFNGKELFIKIDVEGAEYSVLQGAAKTLQATPMPIWVIEVCLDEYHPNGLNPNFAALFDLFWQHGYEARTADARNAVVTREDIERWVRAGSSDSGTINYRFGPSGSN